MRTNFYYTSVRALCAVLSVLPSFVASGLLRRIAPRSWAAGWDQSVCVDVLQDILFSR